MDSFLLRATEKEIIPDLDMVSIAALIYHNLFDYPLTEVELIKWAVGSKVKVIDKSLLSTYKGGYFFLKGREGLILKRVMRKRSSLRKMRIAKKAAKVLALIPAVKLVAISGSLAMENAREDADIDLLIISQEGLLWTTRIISYLLLKLTGFSLRRAGNREEKDRLCLNIWLDELDLSWNKGARNIYTAHEIAQIVPLVNKNKTYEKFLWANRWIKNYWPNAARVQDFGESKKSSIHSFLPLGPFESLAYKRQLAYMRKKISNEIITPTRALFHPVDWGEHILRFLKPRLSER